MKTPYLMMATLCWALATPCALASTLLDRADVQDFNRMMVNKHGFSQQELDDLFAEVSLKPNILSIFDRPSTSRPWYSYWGNFINESRVRQGVAFWRKHQRALRRARDEYGVPEEIITAIIGVETNYGSNSGSFRVMDVVTTMAFDYPRRAEYFRGELENTLLLAREEKVNPLTLRGSYAGAMGWPQFMPSSYRKYAVDFDGDGHRDIWKNPVDAIGSVGNYFKAHGWEAGGDYTVAADITGNQYQEVLKEKFNLKYSLKELAQQGIRPGSGNYPEDTKALLFNLEETSGQTYWLGFNNFYVITRYNKSTLYAMSVILLAERIRQARAGR